MSELADTVNEAVERSREHSEGHGSSGHGFNLNAIVAITVAITATFTAICHVKDENISEKMQHVQAKSVDAWAYYQAKGTKLNIAESTIDSLRLQRDIMPGLTVDARALIDRKLVEYADKAQRYDVEKTEIKRNAEGFEADYERLEARDDQFDMAEATASVAIALLGITALTQRRRLLYVAWAFAGLGIVLGVGGFAGVGIHPDFLARLLR